MNQIDKCKTVDSLCHTTINMATLMYIYFFRYECLRVDVHVSTSIMHSTLPHLLPFMYDFMID